LSEAKPIKPVAPDLREAQQLGIARRKVRTQRRSGMWIVNPLVVYPWHAVDYTLVKAFAD
jgi:hypothetical protein